MVEGLVNSECGMRNQFGMRNAEFGIVVANLPPLFLLPLIRRGGREVKGKGYYNRRMVYAPTVLCRVAVTLRLTAVSLLNKKSGTNHPTLCYCYSIGGVMVNSHITLTRIKLERSDP